MSNMQNYLTSRSPCGYQNCSDKPTDGDIRHKGRVHEKIEVQEIVKDETDPTDESWDMSEIGGHVYDGERCLFCGVNIYDDAIYGPFECVKRPGYIYTTETP